MLFGQHTVTHGNVIWANYNNSIHIDSNWSIVNDAQIRTKDEIDKWSLFALRTGVVYRINKSVAVTAGLAWFGTMNYFYENTVLANEWRPWQELSFQRNIKSVKFIQRLRLEQRFLQKISNGKKMDDFETRHRLRYRFEFGYPVWNKKVVLFAGNEVMGNLNYIKDNRFFDQNRSFLSVNYSLSHSTVFQFQYIRLVQWRSAIKVLENNNVFRCSIHQQY
jgi:hypothetical protein